MQPQGSPYWGQAGSTYYLVLDGRIVALLYWTPEELGEVDGPGGDPLVLEPAWVWVPADDPNQHHSIDAPSLTREMGHEELEAAYRAALDAAQVAIVDYLNREGR